MDQKNISSFEQSERLLERCAQFAKKVHETLKKTTITPFNKRPVEQCSGAVGSIGANYCEATEAESGKDFIHKIAIAKKEVKESRHWIRILATTNPEFIPEWRAYWKEASELLLIFSAMVWTARNGKKKRQIGNMKTY